MKKYTKGIVFLTTLVTSLFFCIAAPYEVYAVNEGVDRIQIEVSQDDYIHLERESPDDKVRLYTYTIFDNEDNEVAIFELRYGNRLFSTAHLWLTRNSETKEIIDVDSEFIWRSLSIDRGLIIYSESWRDLFGGYDYTYTVTSEILPEITAPKNIVWDKDGKPGKVKWDLVEEAENGYDVLIEKDGWTHTLSQVHRYDNEFGYSDFSDYINISGSYIATVYSVGGKYTGDSEITIGEVYVYNRPENEVDTTSQTWWATKKGKNISTIINWQPVAGAYGYWLTVWSSNGELAVSTIVHNTDRNFKTSYDCTYAIERENALYAENLSYTCSVRSLSGDIEVVANSNNATVSDYNTSPSVEEQVSDELTNANAENIVKTIDGIGLNNVAMAMQKSSDVLKSIESLESEYVKENNIEVNDPIVTHSDFKDTNINIVGAGLNAVSGSAIGVEISQIAVEDLKPVNRRLFRYSTQIGISLINDGMEIEGQLKCPITITMDAPQNIKLDRLVILHYHADGTYETIIPKLNDDNTITFSVTSFSTFAFAELVLYTESADDENIDDESPEDNSDENDTSENDYNDSDDEDENVYSNEWEKTADVWKYRKLDGIYAKNEWQMINGKWYYFNSDTNMTIDWQFINGMWYYLDGKNGDMQSDWQFINGQWYYLDPKDGDMQIGWVYWNKKWFFLNSEGNMVTGWNQINEKWYYMIEYGNCLIDTLTPDGYVVDENGAWIK